MNKIASSNNKQSCLRLKPRLKNSLRAMLFDGQ